MAATAGAIATVTTGKSRDRGRRPGPAPGDAPLPLGHSRRRGSGIARATSALLVLVALTSACAGPVAAPEPARDADGPVRVWVVRHEWHTGLVLRAADVPAGAWPARDDFPESEYLEVGWGERDFYQAPEGTVWLLLKAALWPGDSVLHVAALRAPPAAAFPGADVAAIDLSPRGFAGLVAFVGSAHARTAEGHAIALGPGRYGQSRFYLGREPFALTTCNRWTARALRAGGVPVTPFWAITAGGVMSQLRARGAQARD